MLCLLGVGVRVRLVCSYLCLSACVVVISEAQFTVRLVSKARVKCSNRGYDPHMYLRGEKGIIMDDSRAAYPEDLASWKLLHFSF